MKVSVYEQMIRAGATRRDVLKGGASAAAFAAADSESTRAVKFVVTCPPAPKLESACPSVRNRATPKSEV